MLSFYPHKSLSIRIQVKRDWARHDIIPWMPGLAYHICAQSCYHQVCSYVILSVGGLWISDSVSWAQPFRCIIRHLRRTVQRVVMSMSNCIIWFSSAACRSWISAHLFLSQWWCQVLSRSDHGGPRVFRPNVGSRSRRVLKIWTP